MKIELLDTRTTAVGHQAISQPADPREIAAALRAGNISQKVSPYYEWRYGERGRRFTKSDSGWLTSLVDRDQSEVNQQIEWLWQVLSNRGMPGFLLKQHLQILHRCLYDAVPERRELYRKLLVAAQFLHSEQNYVISDSNFRMIPESFSKAFGTASDRLTTGTGRLIVGAVADEFCGSVKAVSSLLSWLADLKSLRRNTALLQHLATAQRKRLESPGFETRWLNAINHTVQAARQCGRAT